MSNKLVHLVEDDSTLRATLARILESGGYSVKQYCSGAELRESSDAIGEEPDGFEAQRKLAERGIRIPVILMTGSGDLTMLALRSGAAEFTQKRFGRGELLSVLDEISIRPLEHG